MNNLNFAQMITPNDVRSRQCPDCAVNPGNPHVIHCDVARCLTDGSQRLSCDLDHNCGNDIWTGQWPGGVECHEFGWYVQDRCNEGFGWVRCTADAPDSVPDLNRLARDARWSIEQGRWVLPSLADECA